MHAGSRRCGGPIYPIPRIFEAMTISDSRKIALVVLVLLVSVCSWYRPITDLAAERVDAGLKRSVISFASARALNGAISVLQGTEVDVHPVGVGVSLSVGEILDPINDLVESLSSVMLMASVAFGIEKLLLAMGSNWVVSVGVTAVALWWCLLFMRRGAPRWLSRLMLALVFVRFVMPVTMLGSAYVFEQFSARDYQQSQAALDRTTFTLQELSAQDGGDATQPAAPADGAPQAAPAPEAKGQGLLDWAQEKMENSLSNFGDPTEMVTKKFEALKAATEDTVDRMVRLIVVFLMQTVVVPVVLLWGLYRLTLGLRMPGDAG